MNPRFFNAAEMFSDSGVFAGTFPDFLQAFRIGFPPAMDQTQAAQQPEGPDGVAGVSRAKYASVRAVGE